MFVGFDLERVSLRGFGGGGGFCGLEDFVRGAGTVEKELITPRGGRRENEAGVFAVSDSGSLGDFLKWKRGSGTVEEEWVTPRGGRRGDEVGLSDSGGGGVRMLMFLYEWGRSLADS